MMISVLALFGTAAGPTGLPSLRSCSGSRDRRRIRLGGKRRILAD
jgi:hypothetical protein